MAAVLNETARALYGASRLARLDPTGLEYFRNTRGAFWRSFNAALIIAPFYSALLLMRFQTDEVSTSALRFFLLKLFLTSSSGSHFQ